MIKKPDFQVVHINLIILVFFKIIPKYYALVTRLCLVTHGCQALLAHTGGGQEAEPRSERFLSGYQIEGRAKNRVSETKKNHGD